MVAGVGTCIPTNRHTPWLDSCRNCDPNYRLRIVRRRSFVDHRRSSYRQRCNRNRPMAANRVAVRAVQEVTEEKSEAEGDRVRGDGLVPGQSLKLRP